MTEGVGYVTGGNINNNPRFWDGPRANNTRAPLTFHLNLFLTDHSSPNTVTIFDGIQYGFRIEEIPEPSTWMLVIAGVALWLAARRR